MELAQSLFVKWIPNIYKSIRTTCGKSIVDVVKGNGVDWVNLLNIVFFQSVTLEGSSGINAEYGDFTLKGIC